MKTYSCVLIMYNILLTFPETKSSINILPGSGCGITTPIRKVEEPQESDTCAIVLDETAYNAYIQGMIHEGKVACTSDNQCQDSMVCKQDARCLLTGGRPCCTDFCKDMTIIDSCQFNGKRSTGANIATPHVSDSMDDCWLDCIANAACQAFAWRCADSICELKGSVGNFEEHLGYISGPRNCPCATPNNDLYSGDVKHYIGTVSTTGECQALCQAHADCINYMFSTVKPKNPHSSTCYLKANHIQERPLSGFITGPKFCP